MEPHKLKVLTLIFICLAMIPVTGKKKKRQKHGPYITPEMETTCDEFSSTARFNPYTMFNATWFVFYYWAPVQHTLYFHFAPARSEQYPLLHKVFDGWFEPPVNWTARHIFVWLREEWALLVEVGDRGQYLLYPVIQGVPDTGKKRKPTDIRFKQTDGDKLVGMFICKDQEMYAMTRLRDLPAQKDIQEVASRLNYRHLGGKSYLYQGDDWMPIPEQDERDFWSMIPNRRFKHGWY